MIRDDLAAAVRSALEALAVDPLPEQISLERPANRDHGDWSTNVALASAKRAGRNPRELAAQLVEHLQADLPAHVEAVEIAGPGFVNFRLAPTWLHDVLQTVLAEGTEGTPPRIWAVASGSTSSSCRPTRRGRSMRATPAARRTATPSPGCSSAPATR